MMAKMHDRSPDEVPGPDGELTGDERMYTGEPVETEDGPRRPQQMNVGVENMEGGGEWPDPNTPPSEGASGATARSSGG
jgi:hypothetical protein